MMQCDSRGFQEFGCWAAQIRPVVISPSNSVLTSKATALTAGIHVQSQWYQCQGSKVSTKLGVIGQPALNIPAGPVRNFFLPYENPKSGFFVESGFDHYSQKPLLARYILIPTLREGKLIVSVISTWTRDLQLLLVRRCV